MNSANHPFRLVKILIITLFVGYFGILMIPKIHALSPDYTIKLCERNFIGANYRPHLESKCSLLWSKWTYEIISSFQ